MEEKKADRRVRRTRALLRQALTELLAEKDARSITVQELTERADVNRGTFYAHYKDIYDMIDKMEEDLFAELTWLMEQYDPEKLKAGLEPVLTDVFRFVAKNKDLLPIFLEQRTADHFLLGLNRLIFQQCLNHWSGVYDLGRDVRGAYSLEFVVSGMVGLVRAWIQAGFRESAEEMAHLTAHLIQNGLGAQKLAFSPDAGQ